MASGRPAKGMPSYLRTKVTRVADCLRRIDEGEQGDGLNQLSENIGLGPVADAPPLPLLRNLLFFKHCCGENIGNYRRGRRTLLMGMAASVQISLARHHCTSAISQKPHLKLFVPDVPKLIE